MSVVASDAAPESGATQRGAIGIPTWAGIAAYAAPVTGGFFFYIPMWSILPGVYAKYFGLQLSSIATVVLSVRIFDGIVIPAVGYLSDRHCRKGGSRKPWIVAGYAGVILACRFLFAPQHAVSAIYYLSWSIAYFLCFAIADIPHVTWGNELTLEYQLRAKVVAVRNVMLRLGIIVFYAMPLLPWYATSEYTPQVLHDAVYVGAALLIAGLIWTLRSAPPGIVVRTAWADSPRLLVRSVLANKPLLVHFAAVFFAGMCFGMWYSVLYFFVDGYLGRGAQIPLMFLVGFSIAALSTPIWLRLVRRLGKSTTWAIGLALLALQSIVAWFVTPAAPGWVPFALVIAANLTFVANDVAGVSIIGDIVDYGKLKFNKDRGSTYVSLINLMFQVALGIGGGVAIGLTARFGFSATDSTHSDHAILGMKLGFAILPLIFGLIAMFAISRTPISRSRHLVIQRRMESRVVTGATVALASEAGQR